MEKTRIIVSHGEMKKIAGIFGKSFPTIRKALRGDINVQDCDKIRKCAVERGGIEVRVSEKNDNIT